MADIGQPAPGFSLESDTGEQVSLESLRGRPAVLYFYPRDDTPGCTRQAWAIRDIWGDFERAGVALFGVSPDTAKSHRAFKEKHGLPFTLLADPDHATADAYGSWVEKTNYGKTYWGIDRSAFVIDADGNLAAAKRRIKPEDTPGWALAEVAKLAGSAAGG
ncbi:MAG: thioredoxin-dependent peroxiredoxin [Gaiellales bacterium]|jgi:peroxiredoxin Q/BCP|nr:thioredoxin-dependent peroxiredoxin [Gaiellales bacterium]